MKIDISEPSHIPGEARQTSIFLGLGSNLGDREANLRMAIGRITALGVRPIRSSSIYETEPVGHTDQPWFLNQVIEMEMQYTPMSDPPGEESNTRLRNTPSASAAGKAAALLRSLQGIEAEMGRERSIPDGPRIIDIDLLLFGELVVDCEMKTGGEVAEYRSSRASPASRIVVPHPRMHLRRFVLEPLSEIAADLFHPVLKRSYSQLLAELVSESVVRRSS